MFRSDGLGNSAECEIDVMCPLGNNWCVERRSVAMLLVDENTAFCTGCLINNVRQDLTPYILTAHHCYFNNDGTPKRDPAISIFRFGYWRPSCNGSDPGSWSSIAGATMMAHYAGSDFALLKLSGNHFAGLGLVYAGWDRSTTPAQNATAIHHPQGDAMKISYDADPVIPVMWGMGIQDRDGHWRATFDQGIVEHSSSGSPLFNQFHRVVGQLHGNYNYDENKPYCEQLIGEYGRFDHSWNGAGTSDRRLRDWLDPDNTGAMSVDAIAPTAYLLNRTLTGNHQFAALNTMHIEGNVQMIYWPNPNPCPINNNPFTTEPGSNVTFKGKSITIKSGTTFKAGSTVSIIATHSPVVCPNLTTGDSFFCSSIIRSQSILENSDNDNNFLADIADNSFYYNRTLYDKDNQSYDKVIQKTFKLFPNPNPGIFQLETNFPLSEIGNLKIVNLLGVTVYETQTLTSNIIQLQNTANGLFFVVAILKDGTVLTQKMMVQR
jgi:hypothetical protein